MPTARSLTPSMPTGRRWRGRRTGSEVGGRAGEVEEEARPETSTFARLEEQVLGVDHPEHARSVSSLAAMYAAGGDLENAVKHMREAVRLHGLSTSPENLAAWSSRAQLARLLIQSGRPGEARAVLEEVRGKISGDSPRAGALKAMIEEDLEAAKRAEASQAAPSPDTP